MRAVLIFRTRGLSKPCWSQAPGDHIRPHSKLIDPLLSFLANYGETGRALKALLALASNSRAPRQVLHQRDATNRAWRRASHWPALRHAPRQSGLRPRAPATEAMFGGHFNQPMVAEALSWNFLTDRIWPVCCTAQPIRIDKTNLVRFIICERTRRPEECHALARN